MKINLPNVSLQKFNSSNDDLPNEQISKCIEFTDLLKNSF